LGPIGHSCDLTINLLFNFFCTLVFVFLQTNLSIAATAFSVGERLEEERLIVRRLS